MIRDPQGRHTRRPPAPLSTCRRHDGTSKASSHADAPSVLERKPGAASPIRRTSNESNRPGESSLQNWFDQSNKRPAMTPRPTLVDSDPPFFLHHHNSSRTSNARSQASRQPHHNHPHGRGHAGLLPAVLGSATNGSSADDFRSVIDDLTIENRKLKERLRRYESTQNVYLEKEKLFEVKVHGLSAKQKRGLEETLRCFAASIDSSSEAPSSKLPSRSIQHAFVPASKNTSSSSTSNLRPVDSAYASGSRSGPISSSTLNRMGADRRVHSQNLKEQEVQSFLHSIPEGLLPKHTLAMTERQKMKMVVRRLEQLFTGTRGAIAGENSQSLLQQEVSKSAAMADRAASYKPYSTEGIREAHILPCEMDVVSQRPVKPAYDASHEMEAARGLSGSTADGSSESSPPEQRPTRPLDLDPDRAQIPSDNVEYLRHLGLSVTQLTLESSADVAADADGWIYLNLLINMAQLHIINVTLDFVRSAVADVSEKFQLSRDGRKVRWRGGAEGTQLSSESGNSSSHGRPPLDGASQDASGRKRRKIDVGRFAAVPVDVGSKDTSSGSTHPNPFHYKPLFQHGSSSSEELTSIGESDSPRGYGNGHSDWSETGRASPGPRLYSRESCSMSRGKLRRDDGPIVFYSGAQFCTDLSCDRGDITVPFHDTAVGRDGYSNPTRDVLGCPSRDGAISILRTDSGSFLPCRPFKDDLRGTDTLWDYRSRLKTPELMTSDGPNNLNDHLIWSSLPSLLATPVDFPACGLGGTQPADHFVVKVETRRTTHNSETQIKLSKSSAPGLWSRKPLHPLLPSSLESFQKGRRERTAPEVTAPSAFHSPKVPSAEDFPVQTEIISAKFLKLEPSELPPPLGHHATLSSSDDDSNSGRYSSSFSDISDMRMGKSRMPRSHTSLLRHMAPVPHRDDSMEEEQDPRPMEDEGDDVSDDSIGMVAPARTAEPKTITGREEEFEREAGRRPMEELPAGSSAAAVGEGSGCWSSGGGSSCDMDFD